MKIRYNAIFIPILAICAFAVWFLGFREEKQAAARRLADRALVDVEELDVIEITRAGETIRLEKDLDAGGDVQENWVMVQPYEIGCDPEAVGEIVSAIFDAESERDFTGVTPEHEAEFGLDNPEITVRLASTSGKVLMDLAFGYENPTKTSRYAAIREDRTQAFLVPVYYITPFEVEPNELRDARALVFDRSSLVSIQLSSAEGDIRLEKTDQAWSVTRPNNFPASPHRLDVLLHDLEVLRAVEFLPEDADDPELRKNDVEVLLAFDSNTSQELILHGEDYSRGIFATSSWQPSPFIVEASIHDRLALRPNVFYHVLLIDFPEEQIERVHVRQPGSENLEIRRTGAGGEDWQILRPEGRMFTEPGDFEQFIDALLALQPEDTVPIPETPQDYGLEPVYFMKIEVYRERNMGQSIIYIGSRDEAGNYYATQDGNSYFTIEGNMVSAFVDATGKLKGTAE